MGRLKAHLHICVVGNMSTNLINDYGHKKKLVDFIVFFFSIVSPDIGREFDCVNDVATLC